MPFRVRQNRVKDVRELSSGGLKPPSVEFPDRGLYAGLPRVDTSSRKADHIRTKIF